MLSGMYEEVEAGIKIMMLRYADGAARLVAENETGWTRVTNMKVLEIARE